MSKHLKQQLLKKYPEVPASLAKVIESEIKGYKKPAKKCMKMIERIDKGLRRDLK